VNDGADVFAEISHRQGSDSLALEPIKRQDKAAACDCGLIPRHGGGGDPDRIFDPAGRFRACCWRRDLILDAQPVEGGEALLPGLA
jgi:hypothetical protein